MQRYKIIFNLQHELTLLTKTSMGKNQIVLTHTIVTIKKIRLSNLLVSMESNHSLCTLDGSTALAITAITYQFVERGGFAHTEASEETH